jgi:hypothetical protein
MVDRHGPLAMQWQPVPARVAILQSIVYDAHLDQSDAIHQNTRLWRHRHAEENVYRAMRLAGYQPQIVFDYEVDGLLERGITALVVPDLEIASQTLAADIREFYAAGGTVIRHEGCAVPVGSILSCDPISDGENPTELAPEFWFWCELSYDDFYQWESRLADALTERLERGGLRPRFPRSEDRAIASFLRHGQQEYCVIVPDQWEPGEYEAWWAGLLKYPESPTARGKFCEVAKQVTARNSSGWILRDVHTGELVLPESRIHLSPGWGRVFRVLAWGR